MHLAATLWLASTGTALSALALGYDRIAAIALALAVIARCFVTARRALLAGLTAIDLAAVGIAIALTSTGAASIAAALAIAFALPAREYGRLVLAHIFRAAGARC